MSVSDEKVMGSDGGWLGTASPTIAMAAGGAVPCEYGHFIHCWPTMRVMTNPVHARPSYGASMGLHQS